MLPVLGRKVGQDIDIAHLTGDLNRGVAGIKCANTPNSASGIPESIP
jgi:hypothetical protein